MPTDPHPAAVDKVLDILVRHDVSFCHYRSPDHEIAEERRSFVDAIAREIGPPRPSREAIQAAVNILDEWGRTHKEQSAEVAEFLLALAEETQ